MTAKEIVENLTIEQIIDIVISLGGDEPRFASDNEYLFKTICHNGEHEGKYKLSYYVNSKNFVCWTECGTIGNIFNLVMHIKNVEFGEAYNYVCRVVGIANTNLKVGFSETSTSLEKQDYSFVNKFTEEDLENLEVPKLKTYDECILNTFYNFYCQAWIDDYITIETMKEFGIMFDILYNCVIIPHRDIDGDLVGIRGRFFNQYMVDGGKKYMPVTIDGTTYKYPTRANFYGIDKHKENIKKYKTVIIGEAEKFVLQHHSYYPNTSTAVALNGSSLHWEQVKILKDLGVENVVIALDKEFENAEEELAYRKKIIDGIISKLYPIFNVSVIWDRKGLLGLKESPTDRGKEVFEILYNSRLYYTI